MSEKATNQDNTNISSDPIVDDLISNIKVEENEEQEVSQETVKDSPSEGNPVNEEVSQGDDIVKDSTSVGQPDVNKESIQSAISQANEKTMKNLEEVVAMLPVEKLAELEESNPHLFNKLKQRIPEVLENKETYVPSDNKADKLEALLETILEAQEQSQIETWRESNKITKEDYLKRKQEFEETAKTLLELDKISDFDQALRLAGEIHFPHLVSTPVDISKLNKIQGQSVNTSNMAPSLTGGEFSDEDYSIMKRNSMTEDEYKAAMKGEIFAPDIL